MRCYGKRGYSRRCFFFSSRRRHTRYIGDWSFRRVLFRSLWPLLIVAFMGPLNPSGGDVSVFLPLEHTVLAAAAPAESRTSTFARYSFVGSLFAAVGALADRKSVV